MRGQEGPGKQSVEIQSGLANFAAIAIVTASSSVILYSGDATLDHRATRKVLASYGS